MSTKPARDDWATPLRLAKEQSQTSGAGSVPQLLTVPDVARMLCLHEKTVYRLVRSGQLPCVRLGSRVRFHPTDVLRWLSARKEG